MSQNTPENTGAYTLRPSIRTSSLFADVLLKPRAEIAHVLLSDCATSSPGTIRNASGMLVTPERRMSSCVITNTAAGDSPTVLARRVTVVTSVFINSNNRAFFSWDPSASTLATDTLVVIDGELFGAVSAGGFC